MLNVEKAPAKNLKKRIISNIALFILFSILFVPVTSILAVRFLPLDNLRKNIVISAMKTLSHHYIANIFASDGQIADIMKEDRYSVKQGFSDGENVKNLHLNDKEISCYDVSSNTYKGKLLKVNDPTRVSVGVSKYLPKSGECTSDIAKDEDAVAAINGGGFADSNYSGTGAKPTGVVISDGVLKSISPDLESDKSKKIDIVGITGAGALVVGYHTVDRVLSLNLKQCLGFGPALIVGSKPMVRLDSVAGGLAPRTAIGQTADGCILMLVIDGRQTHSVGAYLSDVVKIMLKFGAVNASNLDGGSSATMYYKGKVINNPCDLLGERSVPNAFVVKK